MPDLITHVSVAYFLRKPFRISAHTPLFFLGTILPDILTRPVYIIFPNLYRFVYPLHTPFTLILVCALISYFFEEKTRKVVFSSLFLGVLLHLLLDVFQKHLIGSNFWLFPFSDIDVGFGLFWQDDSVYAVPLLLLMIIVSKIFFSSRLSRKL